MLFRTLVRNMALEGMRVLEKINLYDTFLLDLFKLEPDKAAFSNTSLLSYALGYRSVDTLDESKDN